MRMVKSYAAPLVRANEINGSTNAQVAAVFVLVNVNLCKELVGTIVEVPSISPLPAEFLSVITRANELGALGLDTIFAYVVSDQDCPTSAAIPVVASNAILVFPVLEAVPLKRTSRYVKPLSVPVPTMVRVNPNVPELAV